MTYNAPALKARIEDLQKELDRCKAALEHADLPDEPFFPGGIAQFVTFQKRFSKSTGRFYTYAAVGTKPNFWFITGRKPADPLTGMTWRELMDFMVSEESEWTRAKVIETYRVLR